MLCLKCIGWEPGSKELDINLSILENKKQFTRAAAIAVFHSHFHEAANLVAQIPPNIVYIQKYKYIGRE